MCCSNAAWKREEVPDHKFDFINVREFHATNFLTRLQYVWLYILVIKSGAVYIADVYTAVALLASNRWAASILTSEAAQDGGSKSSALQVPFSIGKWIFTGCIIFSFLLLLWEARKARAIIKSRDISYAFTNVMSQNWYSLRSYDHFCFFSQINNSKKKKDEFAFFIFFTFKGWKRLLLADAPRQVINALTLFAFGQSENWTTDLSVYFGQGFIRAGVIGTMLFTLIIWVGSAILLLIAAVMYVPLLCYIQGNLKEYCCHKVDKRIAELMKRKNRKRLAKEAEIARKEAATGKYTRPQPTLPKIGLHDEDLYAPSFNGSDAGSIRRGPGSDVGGRGRGPPSNYAYPPQNGAYPNAGGNWAGSGVSLLDRPPGAPSALSRTAYPYVTSDPDFKTSGYAESVSSLDGFAARAAPMGRAVDERPGVQRTQTYATAMSRTPSYASEDEKVGYAEEYVVDGRAGPPQRSYAPPSRQQLYQRSTERNQSQSSLGYANDGVGGTYGGWEEGEGRQETVAREYHQEQGRGPQGGRGPPGDR